MLQPNDEFLFTRQRHEAEKMGLHYDLRLVHGDKAYSFATLKDMPKPGEIISVFEQPVHDRTYALSEKVVIPTGQYGAGVTTLDWVRKAIVAPHSTEDKLIIYTKDGEKFLLRKAPTKDAPTSWIFRNITGMGKSENPYLKKVEEMQKEASLVGGALATHLLQNIGTSVALKSKHVSKYLADAFAEGAHGVKNNSFKAKATRTILGAGLPDIAVAHKTLHDLGHSMSGLLNKATPRQRAGLRMLSEGRFHDLKKYGLHSDPLLRAAHEHISKHLSLPSLDKLMDKSKEVAHLWKDKSHPLLSNISANISRGKVPEGKNYTPGHLTAKPVISGALTSFAVDPAAGTLNTAKSLMASKKVGENKYGKKVINMLNDQFVKKPIAAGAKAESPIEKNIKHLSYQYGVNPVSAHLKRTSSAVTDALKD